MAAFDDDGNLVQTCDFNYAVVDGEEDQPETLDEAFWRMQGELLSEILRWLTVPKSFEGIGARVKTLCLYLNPSLIEQSSLSQIGKLEGAPGEATLSKALLLFQRQFRTHQGFFQKSEHLCDVYRRSAIVAHEERRNKLNGNGKHKPTKEIDYLREEVQRLKDEIEETESRTILQIKKRASKGGQSHKGTDFAKERAKKAAATRWAKNGEEK